VTLSNPYDGCQGPWLRGNLHGHTSEHSGCASVPLMDALGRYHRAGLDFCAVTDHDHVTDLARARARWPEMIFLEGFEWSTSENVLFIGTSVEPLHEKSLAGALAAARDLLTIICHLQPSLSSEYWTVPMIMALDPAPVGIEVFNGHYNRPHRVYGSANPLYTRHWDALLTRGLRAWGFANDDSHDPHDFHATATLACPRERTAEGLLAALKEGRSYASTGLLMESVELVGARISVRLRSEAEGRFVGPGGAVLRAGRGSDFSCEWAGERYVRFEAEGGAGRIFLQPFFAG
jgi:hypothetical protein